MFYPVCFGRGLMPQKGGMPHKGVTPNNWSKNHSWWEWGVIGLFLSKGGPPICCTNLFQIFRRFGVWVAQGPIAQGPTTVGCTTSHVQKRWMRHGKHVTSSIHDVARAKHIQ